MNNPPPLHILNMLDDMIDLVGAGLLLGSIGIGALAYLFHWRIRGRARFDRADHEGGSPLLDQRVIEMGYWALQPLIAWLLRHRVRAITLTWSAFAIGLIAGISVFQGRFGIAAVLAAIAGICDALDGWIARATGAQSRRGKLLDSALDRYVEFFFIAGSALYYRHSLAALALALAALLASFMVSYSTSLAESEKIHVPRGSMRRAERMVYLVLGASLSPISILWIETPRTDGSPMAFPLLGALALIAVVGNISAARRLRAASRVLGEAESDDTQRREAKLKAL